MTPQTKRVAVVSGIILVCMCVAVGLAVRMIIVESQLLSEQVAAIAVDQSQQVAFTRLQKLAQETEPDRMQLRSYYLQSQSDSINFLNYIERLASDRGLELETINPTEIERDKQTYLSVGYNLRGSLTEVERFIETLESIPYVSQLRSVALTQETGVLWSANITIEVTVLSYEPA